MTHIKVNKLEGHYTIKRFDKLPKRGNSNWLHTLKEDNLSVYYIWTLDNKYEKISLFDALTLEEQNNKVRVIDYGDIAYAPAAPFGLVTNGKLNTIPLVVEKDENVIIKFNEIRLSVFGSPTGVSNLHRYIWRPGKGEFGLGGTPIDFATDLELIEVTKTGVTPTTVTDATTIDLGDIGGDDVATYINNNGPYNLLPDVIYFFTTTEGVNDNTYLYTGPQPDTIGSGASTAVLSSFSLVAQNGGDTFPTDGITGMGLENAIAIWGPANTITYDPGFIKDVSAFNRTFLLDNTDDDRDLDFIIRTLSENTRPGLIFQHDWGGDSQDTNIFGEIQFWGKEGGDRHLGAGVTVRAAQNWNSLAKGTSYEIFNNLDGGIGKQKLTLDNGSVVAGSNVDQVTATTINPSFTLKGVDLKYPVFGNNLGAFYAKREETGVYSATPGYTSFTASENWSLNNYGTQWQLHTILNGENTPSIRVSALGDGRIAFNNGTNQYYFPTTRGTDGQILKTDASGDLSWVDISAVAGDYLPLAGGTMDTNSTIAWGGYAENYVRELSDNLRIGSKAAIVQWIDGVLKTSTTATYFGPAPTVSNLDLGTITYPWDNAYINNIVATGGTFDQITLNNQATTNNHAVRFDQFNAAIANIRWDDSVIDIFDNTAALPAAPTDGDRYIALVTANGWTEDNVYEWDDATAAWIEIVAYEGMTLAVQALTTNYTFNGTSWVEFGTTVSHNNLLGLQGGTSNEYYHLTAAQHGNIGNWDTAYGWGDWSVGVNKAFVDALGINATQLGGLASSDFVRKTGSVAETVSGNKTFTNLSYHPEGIGLSATVATATLSGATATFGYNTNNNFWFNTGIGEIGYLNFQSLTTDRTFTFPDADTTVVGEDNTTTLTNKRLTRRLVSTATPGATPALDIDTTDIRVLTGLNVDITNIVVSGTPQQGDKVQFIFKDDGTARALALGANFVDGGTVTIPITTVANTELRVGFEYSTIDALNKWVCIAKA